MERYASGVLVFLMPSRGDAGSLPWSPSRLLQLDSDCHAEQVGC
jgi:hypothetical protein